MVYRRLANLMGPSRTTATTQSHPDSRMAMVDPRAPRFGQLNTATLLTVGIVVREPILIALVAGILLTAVITKWRINLYGLVWQRLMTPFVGPPSETEPAAPHRFANLMGAAFTSLATILLYGAMPAELPILAGAGYAIAGLVALLAAIAAIGDYCIGCKLYTHVSTVRRLNLV